MIGHYPTATEPLPTLSTLSTELWVKRDDQTGTLYGGNKVRKLERILERAESRSAKRIITIGAVGSHHVLATTLYAQKRSIPTVAILLPQPRTDHVASIVRAALGQGLEAHPARSMLEVPLLLARLRRPGDMFLPPGGTNIDGTRGYLDAAEELSDAVRQGLCPEPDAVVVALGSGGTAAGLLAGIVRAGLSTRVVGVRVVDPWMSGRLRTVGLAKAAGKAAGASLEASTLSGRLEIDGRWLGRGYGAPTCAGEEASRKAEAVGLTLDPTYTAKAFACALQLVEEGRFQRVLYWHTLSSALLAPLLESAPTEAELPPDIHALLLPRGRA